MNTQKVVKRNANKQQLNVHSIFETIQGEGIFVGHPSTFVRLYGCNLMCPMCDTDYTSTLALMSPEDVLLKVGSNKLVIITGGEPLAQDISALVDILYGAGKIIQIETNGTLYLPPLDYNKVTIICSPKLDKVHPKLQPHITAYKYVGKEGGLGDDGLPNNVLGHKVKEKVFRQHGSIPVYLQPEDEDNINKNKSNLVSCIKSCKENGYILGVQLHKIIGED